MDGTQLPRGVADPVGERGAVEAHALAGEDLRLAMQWQMIGELGDQDMGHRGLGRQAARDQAGGGRRLHHPLGAGPAGVARAAGDQHPELGRDHVEPLGAILVDGMQGAAAAGAVQALRLDHDLDARQVRGQRAAVGPAPGGAQRLQRRGPGVGFGAILGDLLLRVFQRQFELVGVQLLRAPPEHRALEGGDDGLQAGDLFGEVGVLRLHGRQPRLQRRRIVRQIEVGEGRRVARHGRRQAHPAADVAPRRAA